MTAHYPEANWDFHNPTQILFGAGRLGDIPSVAGEGEVLLVTTRGFTQRGVTDRICGSLQGRSIEVLDEVQPNPTLAFIEKQTANLAGRFRGTIVAVGGGSAMDTAKVLGYTLAVADLGVSLSSHIYAHEPLVRTRGLPVVAVPTTAGTGSEVTPFATVWDLANGRKYSVASPELFPKVALIDPELSVTLPWETTVAAGLDAVSQALESIWNRNSNPVTEGLALNSLRLSLEALPQLLDNLGSVRLRARMHEASLLAGYAISRTRTALAHSMSYPLTARYGVPHGLACSFMLPALWRFNAELDTGKLLGIATTLGFRGYEGLHKHLGELLKECRVGRAFRKLGVTQSMIESLSGEMLNPERSNNNIRKADREDIISLIRQSQVFADE